VLTTTFTAGPIQQLFRNGQRMTWARTPSTGWLRADSGSGDNVIIDAALSSLPGAAPGRWNGAQVRWRKWSWIYETRGITGDNGGNTLNLGGNTSLPFTGIGSGYFIDNSLAALDAPGEWYFDSGASRLYFYPPAGTSPATMVVEAAWRNDGVTLNGATVEDVAFQHFKNVAIQINNPSTVRRCVVQHITGTGINTSWNSGGTLITGCTLRDILDIGIAWVENHEGVGGTIIERNTLERIGSVPGLAGSGSWHGSGIVIYTAKNVVMRLNRLADIGYAGILLGREGQTVERNVFQRCMATLNDGAAIYTNCGSSIIRENIILDTIGDLDSSHPWTPLGHGIWPEFLGNFANSQILNNTVYGSGGHGLWLPNNYNCTISGNLFVSNHLAAMFLGGGENPRATPANFQQNHTLQNNLLAIGARPWRLLPGLVQNLESWAATNDYPLGFEVHRDRDLDFGTMSDTQFLTRDGLEFVRSSTGVALTIPQWQSTESAWADPAPVSRIGNGYLFVNDTEGNLNFTLPLGVTWQQLNGSSAGSSVALAPFRSVVLLAAGNPGGLSPYYLASGIVGTITLSEWVASYGLTAANAQPLADPDQDGLSNLVEYFFDTIPTAGQATPGLAVALVNGGASIEVSFRKRRNTPSNISYVIESSSNLASWAAVAGAAPVSTSVANDPEVERIAYTLPRDPGGRMLFRLRINSL
jgi:parallel beta-helix repeat protein